MRLTFARALVLVLVSVLGPERGASAQTTDRGEPVPRGQELDLGPDVAQTVGLPRGRRVSGAALEARTEALSARMRCPVCQGNAISDSPSESARNMKAQVRAMIAAGYDDDQIFRYFESSYGEFIRLMPRAEGLNLLVWVLPLVALVLGLGILVGMLRRRAGAPAVRPERDREPSGSSGSVGDGEPAARGELEPWIARVREEVARKDA